MKYVNMQIKVALVMAIVIGFAPTVINAVENEWTTNGPEGGSVYSIAINPEDPNNIFIGSINNGLYKSDNGGDNWQHIDENLFNNTMRDIVFHPFGSDTIFVSSVSGLFKSTNNGNDWEKLHPIGNESEIFAFLIHPIYPNVILIGEIFSTRISNDGGQSWNETDLPDGLGLVDFAVDCSNSNIIYGLAQPFDTGIGIWKSEDVGQTWINIQNDINTNGYGTGIAIDHANSEIIYISLYNRTGVTCLYKSTDGGSSWGDISPDSLTMYAINNVKIMPWDHNTVFVCTLLDGVLKSIDGGQTWQPANNGLKYLNTIDVVFDSLNNIIYLGTINDGIYKSSDGGDSWERISTNINCLGTDEIAVNYFNADKAIVATLIGLYRTEDMGQTWEALDTGCPADHMPRTICYDMLDSNRCYAVTNPYRDYNFIHNDAFYRSLDGGDTWEGFSEGFPSNTSYPSLAISYTDINERVIFLTTKNNGLYISYDGGELWSLCEDDLIAGADLLTVAVAPGNQEVIAIGDFDNNIYLSQDRGATWRQAAELPYHSSAYIAAIAFDPSNANYIYVSSYFLGLYESTDAGESWSCINNDLPVNSSYPVIEGIAINPENPNNIFVTSDDYGIYQTHNGGQNWESFNVGMDTASASGNLSFVPSDTTKLYLASSSLSVWTIERSTIGIDDDNVVSLPSSVNLSAYPNPFNAATRITFNVNAAANVKADIYDVLGRHVANIVNEYLYPGYHSVVWKPEAISTGQYYLKLDDGSTVNTQKMLYIK